MLVTIYILNLHTLILHKFLFPNTKASNDFYRADTDDDLGDRIDGRDLFDGDLSHAQV